MHTTIIIGAFIAMLLAPCVAAWEFSFVGSKSLKMRWRERAERKRLAREDAYASHRLEAEEEPRAANAALMQARADRLVKVAEELVRKAAPVASEPAAHETTTVEADPIEAPVEVLSQQELLSEEELVSNVLAQFGPDPEIDSLVAERQAAQQRFERQFIGAETEELEEAPPPQPVPVVRPRVRLRRSHPENQSMQNSPPRMPAIPLQAVQAAKALRHNRSARITSTEVISRTNHIQATDAIEGGTPIIPLAQLAAVPHTATLGVPQPAPGMAEQFAQQLAQQQTMMQQMQAQNLMTQQLLAHQLLAQQLQQAQAQSQQLHQQLQSQLAAMEAIQAQLVAAQARPAELSRTQVTRVVSAQETHTLEGYEDLSADLSSDMLDDLPSTLPVTSRKRSA